MPKKVEKHKKQKKPLKKTKLKNVVNVKINIDNSKKTTARKTALKPPTPQSFANFPSYQPTRIQQLEPKQQFNNADLTKKIDEMYQKQSQTLNEFERKLIDKYDDSTKKNIPPSIPGAFDTFADNEGNVIFEKPVFKRDTWTKSNELKQNTMLETEPDSFSINRLFDPIEAMPLTIETIVKEATPQERKTASTEIKNVEKEDKIKQNYEDYVAAWREYYENNNYENRNPDINAAGWGKKTSAILNKINTYGTESNRQQNLKDVKEFTKIEKLINKEYNIKDLKKK